MYDAKKKCFFSIDSTIAVNVRNIIGSVSEEFPFFD